MNERALVRADLLVALENAGAITPTELRLDPSISVERYEALGRMLGQLGSSVRWWIGDFIAFGEDRFGEIAPQLSEALKLSAEGRQEYVRVALAIPPNRRRPHLSWSLHRIVSARWITPAQRETFLDRAERDGLTSREMEAAVRELRHRLDGTANDSPGNRDLPARAGRATGSAATEPTACTDLVDDVLADLHADLLDCGFGDGLTVTVVVSAAEVAYRVSIGPEERAA